MKYVLVFWVALVTNVVSAQDLIVTQDGDSLNCKIIKEENNMLYFAYRKEGNVQKTLISTHQVEDYQYNYFKTSDVSGVFLEGNHPKFRMGFSGGWARMLARTSDQVPSNLQQYVKELKSGFFLGADLGYFFSPYFGMGFEYTLFKTSNKYNNFGDNISIHFIGPALNQRVVLANETSAFVASVAVGALAYHNKVHVGSSAFELSGTSLGMETKLGFEFAMSEHLMFCLELSGTFGSYTTFKKTQQGIKNTVDLQENENVSRINLGAGVRFYK